MSVFGKVVYLFGELLSVFGKVVYLFAELLSVFGKVVYLFGKLLSVFGEVVHLFSELLSVFDEVVTLKAKNPKINAKKTTPSPLFNNKRVSDPSAPQQQTKKGSLSYDKEPLNE